MSQLVTVRRPRPRSAESLTPAIIPPEAESLRRLRLVCGLRLADLSRRTGLPINRLSRLERGLSPLTPELSRKILGALR